MSAPMNTSEVVLVLSVLVEVVGDTSDKEHLGFLEAPPEAHPPLGGALIKAVTKVLCI